jgi:hypothetical protein
LGFLENSHLQQSLRLLKEQFKGIDRTYCRSKAPEKPLQMFKVLQTRLQLKESVLLVFALLCKFKNTARPFPVF